MCEHRLPACPRSTQLWSRTVEEEAVKGASYSVWLVPLGFLTHFSFSLLPFPEKGIATVAVIRGPGSRVGGHVFRTIPMSGRGRQKTFYQRRVCAQKLYPMLDCGKHENPGQDSVASRAGQSLEPPHQFSSHPLLFQHLSISRLFMFDALR